MTQQELYDKVVYQRSYFLFWNPIVNKAVGANDQALFGDANLIRLLLYMLQELTKQPKTR